MRFLRIAAVLSIALISVGTTACGTWKRFAYERGDRDSWQQPERVIETLALQPGARVADLGAGSGYFTLHLARAVGAGGKVYAVDVDEEMNAYLKDRLAEEGIDNVEVILGEFEDPLLPDGQIDLLFTSNTFHHIAERSAYFRNVQNDLAAGGRVAVVDYDDRSWFPRLMGHNVEKEVIVEEMRLAGYEVSRDLDFLDRQSFVIFTPTAR